MFLQIPEHFGGPPVDTRLSAFWSSSEPFGGHKVDKNINQTETDGVTPLEDTPICSIHAMATPLADLFVVSVTWQPFCGVDLVVGAYLFYSWRGDPVVGIYLFYPRHGNPVVGRTYFFYSTRSVATPLRGGPICSIRGVLSPL